VKILGPKKVLVEHPEHGKNGKISKFDRFRERYMAFLDRMLPNRKLIVLVYVVAAMGL
jgi:hypothetical protein